MQDIEQAEFCYEHLLEIAQESKAVESFLLYCISQEYISKSDYILNKPETNWFLEFELVTLVSSQESKLQTWMDNWELMSDEKLLAEIYYVAKRDTGVLISKEMFPCLFEWYAKHIFSLPVDNALAERQVNIVSLYLDPNMSKESNQASQLFVRNVVYEKVSKSNNLRTTASGRKLYLQKINNYSKKVTNQLICEAKGNVCDQKLGKSSDVSKERWDNLKECKDAQEVIEEYKNRGDQVAIFHSKKINNLRRRGPSSLLSLKIFGQRNLFLA